ncbi:nitrite reductase small subunit NirD [Chitinophaga silvisoli]|uniref:Nitrite reductase (NAD(P)H) small subunit n=1 Tax=Chitinophaga silvisoli TaxID=2291814 RepID=A0A3E1P943_9BACT|nr:nitrite reductase small subunit NirD [Chitinophaga silvisoli]RFM36703.1 nitrite reductase (NAD(P)H) small subunit [Chitinophaga silvisoli]
MEVTTDTQKEWVLACHTTDVPPNGGVCVKLGDEQVALFYFARRNEWYATQNLCPHRQQMALSRGMTGTQEGEPKVACPFHKKTFSLKDGRCLTDEHECSITTYPVKVIENKVYIGLYNPVAIM